MDAKSLARSNLILALVLLVVATLPAQRATAQNGVCPQYTSDLGSIGGTWPASARICRPVESGDVRYQTGSALAPCGHRLMIWRGGQFSPSKRESGFVYIVPPVYPDTDRVRLRFYNYPQDLWSIPIIFTANWILEINSYNAQGWQIDTRTIDVKTHAHAQIVMYYGGAVPHEVVIVDTHIAAAPGGWIRIQLLTHEPRAGIVYGYSGIQIGPYSNYNSFPDMCPLPDGNPATPTPSFGTSTPTPTPTGTFVPPTATTIGTPYPTAVPGTPMATHPPPAPIIFPTAPSEPTPTPWRSYTMPPINFPSLSFPAIPTRVNMAVTPGAGGNPGPMPTVSIGDGSDAVTRIWQIVDDWQETADQARAAVDVDADVTGVGSPSSLAGIVTNKIEVPVSYGKSFILYLPNTAPHLVAIFLMAAWVIFNVAARPLIGIAKVVFELIRRLWEAIPLN